MLSRAEKEGLAGGHIESMLGVAMLGLCACEGKPLVIDGLYDVGFFLINRVKKKLSGKEAADDLKGRLLKLKASYEAIKDPFDAIDKVKVRLDDQLRKIIKDWYMEMGYGRGYFVRPLNFEESD